MKLRLEDKNKAIELRIQGRTFREIRNEIPNLSKSTLSNWLRTVKLNQHQKRKLEENIKKNSYNARVRSGWTKKKLKIEKIRKIFKEAEIEYKKLSNNRLFIVGLTLYWGEGGKKTEMFEFTNSDPNAVLLMMKWLNEFCGVSNDRIKIRLYMHEIYKNENCEDFWSKVINIPVENFQKTIYKSTAHKSKRNPEYKGCMQLRVLKTDLYWKIMGWLDAITKDEKIIMRAFSSVD